MFKNDSFSKKDDVPNRLSVAYMYLLEGKNDENVIAVPFEDPSYIVYRSIEALPAHIFEEMQHFFRVYKQLEGKETAAHGWIRTSRYMEPYHGDNCDKHSPDIGKPGGV